LAVPAARHAFALVFVRLPHEARPSVALVRMPKRKASVVNHVPAPKAASAVSVHLVKSVLLVSLVNHAKR
jgi:hypothetical protein